MGTETIIMTSIARRLEAGTYRPQSPKPQPKPTPTIDWTPILGTIACGVSLALAFMVK